MHAQTIDLPQLEVLAGIDTSSQLVLREGLDQYLKEDQLQDYLPLERQLEHHIKGAKYPHRLFRANNQGGKSWAGGAEFAMHVTGEYTPKWKGWRFNRPIVGWAAGVTADATRGNVQRMLFGEEGMPVGTGFIPKRCIVFETLSMSTSEPGLIKWARIRHVSGGLSLVKLLFYSQHVDAWQGPSVDFFWWDEEPPNAKHSEGMARMIKTRGRSQMTFTPLKGRSQVYLFYADDQLRKPGFIDTRMTMHESAVPAEEVEAEILKWPEHERTARVYGDPMIGEGLIYNVPESKLICDPIEIPRWWPQGGSMDFGRGHPFAAVKMAWDRDTDTIYVTAEYRETSTTAADDVQALKHWGAWLAWFWPPDGSREEKTTGAQLAEEYRKEGLKMHYKHAQYEETIDKVGGYRSRTSVERGLNDILTRMREGRFKVFSTCTKWFDERRLYHRLDGKVVKKEDDLMDATRGGVMSLRNFKVREMPRSSWRGSPDWQAA